MNKEEKRRLAIWDFDHLFPMICKANSEAIRQGIKPTEVWLGPKEVASLEGELDWREIGEGTFIMGLRVRLMASDGVRVGASFGLEKFK